MPNRSHTLVISGNDPSFAIDLSAFRGVRESTGMTFTRLKNPTQSRLEDMVRRFRREMFGKLPNIHFAAHMGESGIIIQDATLSPERISELFSSAPNMFLAGCESVKIADALSSIDYVLSMIENVSNSDALEVALLWWEGIGNGYTGEEAFQLVEESQPTISEMAFLRKSSFLSRRGRQD